MDQDSSGAIDRTEMFNFMKKKEFVAQNKPKTLQKTKSRTYSEAELAAGGLVKKTSVPEGISLIKVAEKRIAAAKADMGTMQLPEVPEKLTQETDD